MNDVSQLPYSVSRRPAGKFASTNITNELADALNAFGIGDATRPGTTRPLLCLLTGRPAGNTHEAIFSCIARTLWVPADATAASISMDDMGGEDVFTDAVYIDFAGAVDPDVTVGDSVRAWGTLIGYTADEPPKAVFAGLAIQVEDCDEGA